MLNDQTDFCHSDFIHCLKIDYWSLTILAFEKNRIGTVFTRTLQQQRYVNGEI